MPDILDQTDEIETRLHDMRIAAARNAGRELFPNGVCHWCAADVAMPRLFCDGECAAYYERGKKL